jgi:hypothetical protein
MRVFAHNERPVFPGLSVFLKMTDAGIHRTVNIRVPLFGISLMSFPFILNRTGAVSGFDPLIVSQHIMTVTGFIP